MRTPSPLSILGLLGCSLLALALTSCDSLLEEDPEDQIAPTNFYQSAEDAQAAIEGAYSVFLDNGYYFQSWFLMTDVTTDDNETRAGIGNQDLVRLGNYEFTPANVFIERNWGQMYEGVNQVNAVLDNVPDIEMDEQQKQDILGQARFLRALHYFNLVRLYGSVPLVTSETNSLDSLTIPAASEEEVYQQVITDLERAIDQLPATRSDDNLGKATSGAAEGLLAKVHLTREEWDQAAEHAGNVIASGTYRLLDEWKAVFQISNEFNDENMFEVNFDAIDSQGSVHTLYTIAQRYPGGAAWGNFGITDELIAEYSDNDVRGLEGTYMTSPHTDPVRTYEWENGGPAYNKWFDETNATNLEGRGWANQDNNWIVLRYADVLLMYAEAVNEGGTPSGPIGKFDALNMVRERAGIGPVSESLSQSAFRDAVRLERRKELVMEGHRWMDLKRWGILEEAVQEKTGHSIPGPFFPIPQRELDINEELEQNPGF